MAGYGEEPTLIDKFSTDLIEVRKRYSPGEGKVHAQQPPHYPQSLQYPSSSCTVQLWSKHSVLHMGWLPQEGPWGPKEGSPELTESDVVLLNEPLSTEELQKCILASINGKAADLEGMTMEALKAVVQCEASSMLECIRHIVDNCDEQRPKQMCLNKLIPLPKSSASLANLGYCCK